MLASRRDSRALAGLVVAQLVAATVAGVAGASTAPLLGPNARALIVAVALVAAGVGAMVATRVEGASGAGTSPFGGFVEGLAATLGDRSSFLVFALAVRGPSPIAATAGGAAAALLVLCVANAIGESRYGTLPVRPFSVVAGLVLLVVGLVVGLSALRLI